MSARLPEKPGLEGLEARWLAQWDESGVYRFDRSRPREDVFSIDTPPPTVSGSLHVGHVCSYTHTDTVARYQRMQGREVFYPMGWDDNGLPTERRVQNFYGVRCDPSLPFDPTFEPHPNAGKLKSDHRAVPIARGNFLELCEVLVKEDEKKFEELWRNLGLSVDWSMTYTTIGGPARRISQRAFLRNLARGEAYQADAPTSWDVDDQTAIAQAEMEDREMPGAYHRLAFASTTPGGDPVMIETTRPELLAACVALVAHPSDERFAPLFGTTVTTPLFDVEVPVVAHRLADPEKGSGIAMICTFGDSFDVTWWRELQLPIRSIIEPNGRITADPHPALTTTRSLTNYGEIAGKSVKQAQTRTVELLRDSGEMEGEPRPITHAVKFYERGKRPLEIVASRQWYIRNGGRDEELRAAFIARGREINWIPAYMRQRYESWVEGLAGDWLISRQRYSGVPFPVWYRLDSDGAPRYDDPILADETTLPVDPSSDLPPGFTAEQRDQPNGFCADPNVMDTWATSSLTPMLAGAWEDDPDLFSRVFPMDLRPQAYEIIRTWLFSTVVRSHFEHGELPWKHAALSGWVLDPDRKKMSKSVGNVVVPTEWIDKYGADAVRYWAASARPGVDTTFDEGQIKVGRKLAMKLLNVSKFVLGLSVATNDDLADVTEPLDHSLLHALAELIDDATAAFEVFDYARALERTERFFWSFCDNYVELVKTRAYQPDGGPDAQSAAVTLRIALHTLLRLFAPFVPFVSEEVWSWWRVGSVHRAAWPTRAEVVSERAAADPLIAQVAGEVLSEVRKAKSEQKRSLATPVAHVVVRDTETRLAALARGENDVRNAGKIAALRVEAAAEFSVSVELAEPDAA